MFSSGDVQARVRQARGQITVRKYGVVGEDQEGDVLLAKSGEELVRARKRSILLDQDAVHVREPRGDGRQIGQWCRFVRQGSHAPFYGAARVGSVNEFENGCDIARDGACGNDEAGAARVLGEVGVGPWPGGEDEWPVGEQYGS